MRSVLPIASVILALFAAGCIAYVAWAAIKQASQEEDPPDSE